MFFLPFFFLFVLAMIPYGLEATKTELNSTFDGDQVILLLFSVLIGFTAYHQKHRFMEKFFLFLPNLFFVVFIIVVFVLTISFDTAISVQKALAFFLFCLGLRTVLKWGCANCGPWVKCGFAKRC